MLLSGRGVSNSRLMQMATGLTAPETRCKSLQNTYRAGGVDRDVFLGLLSIIHGSQGLIAYSIS